MPCKMGSQMWPVGKWPWHPGTGEWLTGEQRLTQRFRWLIKCAHISFFNVWAIHIWQRRRSYYFAETQALVKEVVIEGQIRLAPDYEAPHECYFLGSFPIYWDEDKDVVTYAHVFPVFHRSPLLKRPSHSTLPGWSPTREQINEYVPRDDSNRVLTIPWGTDQRRIDSLNDWETLYKAQFNRDPTGLEVTKMGYFFGIEWELPPPGTPFLTNGLTPDASWISMEKQQQVIDNMDRITNECINKNYLDKPKVPQRLIRTPWGPSEWPGKPISQLGIPAPIGDSAMIPEKKLRLTISFGFTQPTSPDGLSVQLELI